MTAGRNLKSKNGRYKGDTALYQKNTLQRKPYYAVTVPEARHQPASKSAMTKRELGKHWTNPIMGISAMENNSLPDVVVDQAYGYISRSIAVGTMRERYGPE